MKTKQQPKTDQYRKYLDYIKHAGGNPTLKWFDDDWSPTGPYVRDRMKSLGIVMEIEGRIYLK